MDATRYMGGCDDATLPFLDMRSVTQSFIMSQSNSYAFLEAGGDIGPEMEILVLIERHWHIESICYKFGA